MAGEERMKKRTSRILVHAACAAALAGCGGSDADVAGRGAISIAVTDAPVDDAAAVVIAMTEFELKPAGGASFRVPVIGAPRQLDLTDFTDGAAATVIEGEDVPAGDYEWMRIYFDESASYIQLESDGTTYPLVIPSGGQTGFKLVSGFTVPVNDEVTYLLDFDVRKSVTEPPGQAGPNGEPRRFVLKPVVRVMNVAETGGVEGVVDASLVDLNNERCLAAQTSGNAVYVFEGLDAVLDDVADEETDELAPPLTSDIVDLNETTGEFEYHLAFLLPGPYTLAFTCSGMADGAGDDDYPPTPESAFDVDATINVDVVAGGVKSCAIPAGDGQEDPC
jgi:hypothetical protein